MNIVTLTYNPCIDVTEYADDFGAPANKIAEQTGGKGINVARVLGNLGMDALAVCPLGGETGEKFRHLAAAEGINLLPVPVSAPTRVITTHVRKTDNAQRVDYVRGCALTAEELDALEARLFERLRGGDILAVCGSASCKAAAERVPGVIRRARELGAKTLLDSNGEALIFGANALPDLIKPNEDELFELTGIRDDPSRAARALMERGISGVLVSLGKSGCMLAMGDTEEYCPAPTVKTVNPVGSGDSFVAGFICACVNGYAAQSALMIACAAGAANAAEFPAARITRQAVENLLGWKF